MKAVDAMSIATLVVPEEYPAQALAMNAHHAGMPAGRVAGATLLPFVIGGQYAGNHALADAAMAGAFARLVDCAEGKRKGVAARANGCGLRTFGPQHRAMREKLFGVAVVVIDRRAHEAGREGRTGNCGCGALHVLHDDSLASYSLLGCFVL